jgi:hypothetical protein
MGSPDPAPPAAQPQPTWTGFLKDAGERAVRTACQTLLAYFGAGALSLFHTDWVHALDLAGGAAVLSLLTSMVALPFGAGGTASFTKAVVPAALLAFSRYGKHSAPTQAASQGTVTANFYLDGRFTTELTGRRAEFNSTGGLRMADAYAAMVPENSRAEPAPKETLPVAAGMHAHPTKKLGKLPPIPGRAAVPFRDFVRVVPDHPVADPAPQLVYPMYRNDEAGCCVAAAVPHTLQTIAAALGLPWQDWSDDELLKLYQTQNPGFHSWADAGNEAVDGGMVIQTCLEYLVAQGTILAFGKIDHTDPEEMRAAIYLGLAIITGEELDVAQQNQTVWDYKRSADWGGHATCSVGYPGSTRQTCVTWGSEVDMTEAFIAHQLDEAWFVLTQAHVDHAAFRDHFDLPGFAAAVAQITGGKAVVPVPAPQPPPAPGPAPVPPAPPAPAPVPVGPSQAAVEAAGRLAAWVLSRKDFPPHAYADARAWQAGQGG